MNIDVYIAAKFRRYFFAALIARMLNVQSAARQNAVRCPFAPQMALAGEDRHK